MHKIADRLDLRPSSRNGTEGRPGEIGQKVGFAISACPKERKRFGGQSEMAQASAVLSTSSFSPEVRNTPSSRSDREPEFAHSRLTIFPSRSMNLAAGMACDSANTVSPTMAWRQ